MTDYLECPCCGDVGAVPNGDGEYVDQQRRRAMHEV
jgi:hypothetical protein